MKLISKSDIEAIQISNLLCKSYSRKNTFAAMQDIWEKDNTKPDTTFLFATYALANVYVETVAPERHKYLSKSIEALSDCIKQQDDWWMARYFRSSALQAIIISADGMSLQSEEDEDDCDVMISQQLESKVKAPYFLCPYLVKAKTYIYRGSVDQAVEIIEEGIDTVEPKKIRYPLNTLLQPFADSITSFRNVDRDDIADKIKYFGCTLFPSSKSLAAY